MTLRGCTNVRASDARQDRSLAGRPARDAGRDSLFILYSINHKIFRRNEVLLSRGKNVASPKVAAPWLRLDGRTNAFTLLPDNCECGWTGRFRGVAGDGGFQVGGEVGAREYQGNWALSLRASLRIGL